MSTESIKNKQIALQLAYDGTLFSGYQVQPARRTVEGELKKALKRFTGEDLSLICAGRTDAGVHAYAQLAAFYTSTPIPTERFATALNHMLPGDIRVMQAFEVPSEFSARFSAQARHYRYLIMPQSQAPALRNHAWQLHADLDISALAEAWHSVRGLHNFKAFCASGSYRKNFEIDVKWTHCWRHQEYIVLEIMAQSFLYNMVRSLVGSAVDIARGRSSLEHLQQALATQDRQKVKFTAPPQGLYLYHVLYPNLPVSLVYKGLHNQPVPVGDIPQQL